MDLRAFGHFEAIIRAGSYVKAAALVNVTQPALSKSIAQLERECGHKLLERGRRGVCVQPTEAGRIVLASTKIMLGERERLLKALHDVKSDPHVLSMPSSKTRPSPSV